jgi:hypothetical protein
MSKIYPGRRAPDLSGLVGMLPRAIYIMLPVEPGDEIDAGLQGGTFPNRDETANNDGWGAFSGTSAAAPQLAGVAALIRQTCPRLTPAEIRDIMMSTARDVTTGKGHPNTGANPAGPGPDLATGNGLVDAQRAVAVAKLRCLGPIGQTQPIAPVQPIGSAQPITPVQPIGPIPPIQPITPVPPMVPPVERTMGIEAGAAGQPEPSALSAEDVAALEEMLLENPDFDLGQ